MNEKCKVQGCTKDSLLGRSICEFHAYPAARPKKATGRRAAIEATKKKIQEKAKASRERAEE